MTLYYCQCIYIHIAKPSSLFLEKSRVGPNLPKQAADSAHFGLDLFHLHSVQICSGSFGWRVVAKIRDTYTLYCRYIGIEVFWLPHFLKFIQFWHISFIKFLFWKVPDIFWHPCILALLKLHKNSRRKKYEAKQSLCILIWGIETITFPENTGLSELCIVFVQTFRDLSPWN